MVTATSARRVCAALPSVVAELVSSFLLPRPTKPVNKLIKRELLHVASLVLSDLAQRPTIPKLQKQAVARRALEAAAQCGHIEMMEEITNTFAIPLDELALFYAVEGGHLEAARWVYEHLRPKMLSLSVRKRRHFVILKVSEIAAMLGHLDILEWWQDMHEDYAVSVRAATSVVSDCHVHIIGWLRAHHPVDPEDANVPIRFPDFSPSRNDFRDQMLKVRGLSVHYANANVDEPMVDAKWLQSAEEAITTVAMHKALMAGDLETAQRLLPSGTGEISYDDVDKAAAKGNLAMVRLLLTVSPAAWTVTAMESAASHGHLEVLQFLHEKRPEELSTRPSQAMEYAAEHGHLNVVQWLHSLPGEETTTEAMDNAARFGHLDVVEFLHTHRSEGCTMRAMDGAADNGWMEVVQFLHSNRSEGCTTQAMDNAAVNGHLHVVQWLHDHRTEGCTTNAMDGAACRGHLSVVQYLHTNRTEGCRSNVLASIMLPRHANMFRWLVTHNLGFSAANLSKTMTKAMISVVTSDDFVMMHWIHSLPVDIDIKKVAKRAIQYGRLEVLLWLKRLYPKLASRRLARWARKAGRWRIWRSLLRRHHRSSSKKTIDKQDAKET